jgi:hypothetical protein
MVETYSRNDQTGSRDSAKSPAKGNTMSQPGSMVQDVAEQAKSAGRDFKDRAADLASTSADTIRNQASDMAEKAKDFASQTGEKVKQVVDDQRGVGADYVGNLADTMRRAAREFDSDLPIAGAYIRKAAAQIENVSDAVRTGDFQEILKGAQSFARRQPTAFLGLSVLAGFGVVRFLKSSAGSGTQAYRPDRDAAGGGYSAARDQSRGPSGPSVNRGGGYSQSGTMSRPS